MSFEDKLFEATWGVLMTDCPAIVAWVNELPPRGEPWLRGAHDEWLSVMEALVDWHYGRGYEEKKEAAPPASEPESLVMPDPEPEPPVSEAPTPADPGEAASGETTVAERAAVMPDDEPEDPRIPPRPPRPISDLDHVRAQHLVRLIGEARRPVKASELAKATIDRGPFQGLVKKDSMLASLSAVMKKFPELFKQDGAGRWELA
tara:strand:+ start:408 stop:1019 length:612 start_codon:yes stop_codon:yes gene_type:complete